MCATGGVCLGLLCGVATRLVLKWMHRRGHKAPEQLALTVAMAYLVFYVANGPCARPHMSPASHPFM
jgi:NhaP-type Na+/H+ or K+/H+ antiporter